MLMVGEIYTDHRQLFIYGNKFTITNQKSNHEFGITSTLVYMVGDVAERRILSTPKISRRKKHQHQAV